jgi:hypothetical protein
MFVKTISAFGTDLFFNSHPRAPSVRCLEYRYKTYLSPKSSILINSPFSQPHRFQIPHVRNHRHTRPTFPPFLRRTDDGLD